MIISVTERQTYKRCPRKWDYSSFNRQGLQSVINAAALELGTLIHATIAQWTSDPTQDPIQIYAALASKQLEQLITRYQQAVGCNPSNDELLPILDAMALGQHMIENYKQQWRTPLPPGYDLVENEQTVLVNIPGTKHCGCVVHCIHECTHCIVDDLQWHNKPQLCECHTVISCKCIQHHILEATFDGVMADAHGSLFIIERKTYSRTPSIDELDENDQFLAYIWALQTSMQSNNIHGVAYDGLWKRAKPTQAKPKLSDLFLRRTLMRNQHEVEEFGKLLALEAMQMARPDVPIYKNVPPLGGCWDDSSFRPLCKAQSRDENYAAIAKLYVHRDRADWHTQRGEEE